MKKLKEELDRNKELMGVVLQEGMDKFSVPTTQEVLNKCTISVGGGVFLDQRTPAECQKFMLANIEGSPVPEDAKYNLMIGCTTVVFEEVFQEDEEKGDAFLNFLVNKANAFKNCVEKQGVDVFELLDDL